MPQHTQTEGVPLNIWQVAARTGRAVRTNLAARAIDAYSEPASLVVDLLPGRGEVLAAAVVARRSAFTSDRIARCRQEDASSVDGVARLALALPLPDRLAPLRPCHVSPVAARSMARRARRFLSTGGLLAVGVIARPGHDDLAGVVETVRSEGLAYFQHVIALARDDVGEGTASHARGRGLAHIDLLVFEARV